MISSITKLNNTTYQIYLGGKYVNGTYVGESSLLVSKDQIKNIHKYEIGDDFQKYADDNFGGMEGLLLYLEIEGD